MKKTVNRILNIFRSICLLAFVIFSALSVYTIYQDSIMLKSLDSINIIYNEAENENELYNQMKSENSDYKGWLTVYGTAIDGPVVQGENNDEYLRKDFFGENVVSGTFFLDENVTDNSNLIIYGHMMRDDTMFGPLRNYKDIDFFKENNILSWQGENKTEYYELFAGMIVSGSYENIDYVNIYEWLNNDDEKMMLSIIKDRSYIFLEDITVPKKENKYIFLVTCENFYNDNKIILVGKRM